MDGLACRYFQRTYATKLKPHSPGQGINGRCMACCLLHRCFGVHIVVGRRLTVQSPRQCKQCERDVTSKSCTYGIASRHSTSPLTLPDLTRHAQKRAVDCSLYSACFWGSFLIWEVCPECLAQQLAKCTSLKFLGLRCLQNCIPSLGPWSCFSAKPLPQTTA